jgi:hypothetical protein
VSPGLRVDLGALHVVAARVTLGTVARPRVRCADVVFEMPIEAVEVAAAGEARYVFDGPFDADTFETTGPEGDLVLSW